MISGFINGGIMVPIKGFLETQEEIDFSVLTM